jgi:hypothetical protein
MVQLVSNMKCSNCYKPNTKLVAFTSGERTYNICESCLARATSLLTPPVPNPAPSQPVYEESDWVLGILRVKAMTGNPRIRRIYLIIHNRNRFHTLNAQVLQYLKESDPKEYCRASFNRYHEED